MGSVPDSSEGGIQVIKRTPQEIADMLKAYVAQDQAGGWYAYNYAPRRDSRSWYDSTDASIGLDVSHMIETPADHDWTVLYSPNFGTNQQADEGISPESGDAGPYYGTDPHPDSKVESYYQNRPDFDNKHQYEVHAHAEYRVVSAVADTEDLDTKVNKLIAEGWRPQGGVAFMQYDDNHYDTFYQAMVRGV